MLKINIPENWAEKPSPPRNRENVSRLDLSISWNLATLVQLAEQPSTGIGNFFWTGSIHFMQFQATFGFRWQKSLSVRDPAHVTHVEYSWSPYYKSTLRFLLSKYLL